MVLLYVWAVYEQAFRAAKQHTDTDDQTGLKIIFEVVMAASISVPMDMNVTAGSVSAGSVSAHQHLQPLIQMTACWLGDHVCAQSKLCCCHILSMLLSQES
jgi:hypothetical protein